MGRQSLRDASVVGVDEPGIRHASGRSLSLLNGASLYHDWPTSPSWKPLVSTRAGGVGRFPRAGLRP
ncbi:MAG: hypothetical protein VX470_01785, partial [Planctomycetota bacterium]|nr:hypothetical protein [Planctomycetota bacterium]